MTRHTVVVGEHPQFEAWLATRRAHGAAKRDEVWEGVPHLAAPEHGRNGIVIGQLIELLAAPARGAGLVGGGSFNLGSSNDFRVPALGYHRRPVEYAVFMPSAALVIEVQSPDDESVAKLPFYAAHGVGEVWLVDPIGQLVRILLLHQQEFVASEGSTLLGLTALDIERELDWPSAR